MRKVVAGVFVSLDGVMEAPDKWHIPFWSDEMGEVVNSQIASSDALLLGRVTYQEFAAYWPGAPADDDPIAPFMINTPKYVVSNTLDKADWNNSTLIRGNVAQEIARLKRLPGKNINVTGSATLVQFLLQNDLLDELNLLVHPIVVGSGKRLFKDGVTTKTLRLVEAKTFPTGVLSLVYQPAAQTA